MRGQRVLGEGARLLLVERRPRERTIEGVFWQTDAADHVETGGQLEAPGLGVAQALSQKQHVGLNALVANEDARRHQRQYFGKQAHAAGQGLLEQLLFETPKLVL